jgi:hypothetical protein
MNPKVISDNELYQKILIRSERSCLKSCSYRHFSYLNKTKARNLKTIKVTKEIQSRECDTFCTKQHEAESSLFVVCCYQLLLLTVFVKTQTQLLYCVYFLFPHIASFPPIFVTALSQASAFSSVRYKILSKPLS